MPDDPMPRRVRPQDRDDAASAEERGKARLTDELMSQFDAIERVLRARRDAEADLDDLAAEEQTFAAEQVTDPRPLADPADSPAPNAANGSVDPATRANAVGSNGPARPLSAASSAGANVADGSASPAKSAGSNGSAVTMRRSATPAEPSAAPAASPKSEPIAAPSAMDRPPRRRRRVVLLTAVGAAVAALVVVATVLAVTPASNSVAPRVTASASVSVHPSPTPDEVQAAQWVADHVGPDHVVACDVNLCALVRQFGASAASLVTAGSDISEVERADVLISTSLMRADFGTQLTQISSAEPLASFGAGADQVVVTAVAIDGSADYGHRLTSDRSDRSRIGAAVARNPRITFGAPTVAAELRNGVVDSRLSSLLTLISSSHAFTVASFGGTGPGAGADVPNSDAVISRVDGRPVGGSAPQAAALIALVDAQLAPYRPLNVVNEADGVKISFSQPEPLGLIAGATP